MMYLYLQFQGEPGAVGPAGPRGAAGEMVSTKTIPLIIAGELYIALLKGSIRAFRRVIPMNIIEL